MTWTEGALAKSEVPSCDAPGGETTKILAEGSRWPGFASPIRDTTWAKSLRDVMSWGRYMCQTDRLLETKRLNLAPEFSASTHKAGSTTAKR